MYTGWHQCLLSNTQLQSDVSEPVLCSVLAFQQTVLSPAGFQPIPALASLEGLLNSLASDSTTDETTASPQHSPKAQKAVQHRGTLGFLQGFLKLQQAMQAATDAQNQSQACFAVSLIQFLSVAMSASSSASPCHAAACETSSGATW